MEKSTNNTKVDVPSFGLSANNAVDTSKIASSPYFQTFVSAWEERFPQKDVAIAITADAKSPLVSGPYKKAKKAKDIVVADKTPKVAKKPASASVKASKYTCRFLPLLLVCILSVVVIAVAVLGIFKIGAIADYVALSGKYESIVALTDCFSLGGATIEGVFSYVLPVALYLSLAVVVIVLVISILGMAKRCCGSISWLSLVALLLGLLSAVSLYLVMDAPAFADFIDFGGESAIGYGLLGIIGLELIIFIVSLFVIKKKPVYNTIVHL